MSEKKQSQISVKVPGSGFAPVWVRWSMNVAQHRIGVTVESREVSHVHRKHWQDQRCLFVVIYKHINVTLAGI